MNYSFKDKNIILILEGSDCSGKSTLAEALRKLVKGMFWKITDVPTIGNDADRNKIKHYYWNMLTIMEEYPWNWIIDRFYLSELVYSKIKRGYEAKDDPEFAMIEDSIRSTRHLFVLCDPGIETIKSRMNNRGDDYVKIEELDEIYERYNQMFETMNLNKLRVNTNMSSEQTVELIANKINELYEHK